MLVLGYPGMPMLFDKPTWRLLWKSMIWDPRTVKCLKNAEEIGLGSISTMTIRTFRFGWKTPRTPAPQSIILPSWDSCCSDSTSLVAGPWCQALEFPQERWQESGRSKPKKSANGQWSSTMAAPCWSCWLDGWTNSSKSIIQNTMHVPLKMLTYYDPLRVWQSSELWTSWS